MKASDQIRAAIASIEEKIQQLENAGVEKGSVQRYYRNSYRLAWREGDKIKFSTKLDPSTVSWHRAAHKRWLRCEDLRRMKAELLELLGRQPSKRLLKATGRMPIAS